VTNGLKLVEHVATIHWIAIKRRARRSWPIELLGPSKRQEGGEKRIWDTTAPRENDGSFKKEKDNGWLNGWLETE